MSNYGNDYLIHYGVKNMKWGVRRYQNEDGSLTQLGKEHYGVSDSGNKKLQKKYEHETKKLQKLEDRADVEVQQRAAEKHIARAKKAGKIGAAAALTAVGAERAIDGVIGPDARKLQNMLDDNARKLDTPAERLKELIPERYVYADNLKRFVKVQDLGGYSGQKISEVQNALRSTESSIYGQMKKVSDVGSAVFVASSAVAAASLGTAAYNAIAAAVNKRRLTDKGHAKAVARRDAQYQKISNMVKDTPYMALFKDQIEAYKKEHPNSELSDKQIMKNLM